MALLVCDRAYSEFRCETKIGYTVEFAPKDLKPTADTSASKNDAPAPTGSSLPSRESTIQLAVVEAKGADEAAAKAALQKASVRQLERVRGECRKRHENSASCIASKFDVTGPTIRGLDFSARKAVEEAIKADCETQRGTCKKVEATEAVCAEIVVAAAASVSPEAGAEAGKDDKKKGKK
jgi:hypothetical protein